MKHESAASTTHRRLPLRSALMPRWTELVDTYLRVDIPAPQLRLITIAQWAIESGWGSSELAERHNNFGGLKYHPRMKCYAKRIRYHSKVDGPHMYCKFADAKSFVRGYWHFIKSGRWYSGWESFSEDPIGYIRHLKNCGYAEDGVYVESVCRVYTGFCEQLRARPEMCPALVEHLPPA